jgi:hypothetical protein
VSLARHRGRSHAAGGVTSGLRPCPGGAHWRRRPRSAAAATLLQRRLLRAAPAQPPRPAAGAERRPAGLDPKDPYISQAARAEAAAAAEAAGREVEHWVVVGDQHATPCGHTPAALGAQRSPRSVPLRPVC